MLQILLTRQNYVYLDFVTRARFMKFTLKFKDLVSLVLFFFFFFIYSHPIVFPNPVENHSSHRAMFTCGKNKNYI